MVLVAMDDPYRHSSAKNEKENGSMTTILIVDEDPPPVKTGVYDAKPAQAGCGRAKSHPMLSTLQRTSGC
jgi:hypothetical protein